MVRVSEVVLPGHPDKLCDQIADAAVRQACRLDPEAFCQIEVSCWQQEFFLTGAVIARSRQEIVFEEIVKSVAKGVGYTGENAVNADRFQVRSAVIWQESDPTIWTRHVNDQSIAIGYAGYDEKTWHLPPEHFLAHHLGKALSSSCSTGRLKGQGPDGKVLVRMREEGAEWILEHVLVTIQHLERTTFAEVSAGVLEEVSLAYESVRSADARWVREFEEVEVLINPNGPLVLAGPFGDNGQTGRKLVMDFYGPRVPIGGGALYGKHPCHIDRFGARVTRDSCLRAVRSGAAECLVRATYGPNAPAPLDVHWEMRGQGERMPTEWFSHQRRGNYRDSDFDWRQMT